MAGIVDARGDLVGYQRSIGEREELDADDADIIERLQKLGGGAEGGFGARGASAVRDGGGGAGAGRGPLAGAAARGCAGLGGCSRLTVAATAAQAAASSALSPRGAVT